MSRLSISNGFPCPPDMPTCFLPAPLVDQATRLIPDSRPVAQVHIRTTHPLRPAGGSPALRGRSSRLRLLREGPTSCPATGTQPLTDLLLVALPPGRPTNPGLPVPGRDFPTFRPGARSGLRPPLIRGPPGQKAGNRQANHG